MAPLHQKDMEEEGIVLMGRVVALYHVTNTTTTH